MRGIAYLLSLIHIFYDWCEIASIYGAPADCLWGGGRAGFGDCAPQEVLELMREYEVSARLTFSNSLLKKEHLSDKKCNMLCAMSVSYTHLDVYKRQERCTVWDHCIWRE